MKIGKNINALFGYKRGKRKEKKWIIERKWERKDKKLDLLFMFGNNQIRREGEKEKRKIPLFGLQ